MNTLETVNIYEAQIQTLIDQAQMLEAIALGQNALARLGVNLPSEPEEHLTGKALQSLSKRISGQQIEELISLPVMSNPTTIAAMQLLAMLSGPIFRASPTLLPLLCATMINLSLEFGNTSASTIGYVSYGMVLSAFLGEVEKGYRFGQLALNLVNHLNAQEFKPLTLFLFGTFLQHRQEGLRAIIPTMKKCHLAGMETGDFRHAGYSIAIYADANFYAGVCLNKWEAEIENYCVVLETMKQNSPLTQLKLIQQTVQNWRKIVNQPDLLRGTFYDETVMLPKHHQDNDFTVLKSVYIHKIMLAYFFGNYSHALDYIAQANLYLRSMIGTIYTEVFHFYAGLSYLAVYSTLSEIEQAKILALVETHQTTLAQWAQHNPMNHLHKWHLVEAERQRVLGNQASARENYDYAIAIAKEKGYIPEVALASELAAKFYLALGKEKIAVGYMQEAYCYYAQWGATAKTGNLEKGYSQLLRYFQK
ncbi:serine/threonine protein kinase with two-component sensor domain [Calothrix sp. NIES-4101]|nr:serine/threonine protein kinase with two-component sensor domain [Calothrix sp. NIES-4101]